MDIRTKLVFALVGTSLLSMLALGTVGYAQARRLLRDTSLRQLDALAESRKRDLEAVIDGWGERVGLIGSRTQLRRSLSQYSQSNSRPDSALIARIIDDVRGSASSVASVAIYDGQRRLVASSAAPGLPAPQSVLPDSVASAFGMGPPRFFDLSMGATGASKAHYVMPLELGGEGRVGWLAATLDVDDLIEVANDTTGLGMTGETLIVAERDGVLQVLHRRRHDIEDSERTLSPGAVRPSRLALAGRDTVLFEDAFDDRNRRVWAATRHIPAVGWGIVVKVDAAEEREPVVALRDQMARLALSLAAFAILAGVLLGLHLARPIHDLAEVANRIRDGETHVRATVHHEDEVGMLARTFNRMADTLTRGRLTLADESDEDEEQEDGAA